MKGRLLMKERFLMKHGQICIFYTKVKKKPLSLICQKSISTVKEYSLKQYYNTEYKTKFECLEGESKKRSLTWYYHSKSKQKIFNVVQDKSNSAVCAS